jgi:hypothetical protein
MLINARQIGGQIDFEEFMRITKNTPEARSDQMRRIPQTNSDNVQFYAHLSAIALTRKG